jgi:hypothetical protein
MGFKYMQAYRCLKKFVNQYTLQKTLRFELVPNPITKKILEIESAKKSFLNDRERNKAREELKEMLKELDNEFIQEALRDFQFSKQDLQELWEKYKKDKKSIQDKDLKKLESKIEKRFSCFSSSKYGKIKFTKQNILSEKVIKILKEKYKDNQQKQKIIDLFDRFTTYITDLKQNRENYYKAEGKTSQFATRAVRDNLIRFFDNKFIFENKYSQNFGFSEEEKKIFLLSYYNGCLLQKGIDRYNELVGNLNSKINQYILKHKNNHDFKKSDYPFFKKLDKQIVSSKDVRKSIEINDDQELIECLDCFYRFAQGIIPAIKKLWQKFFEPERELGKIYLPRNKANRLSYYFFGDWSLLSNVYGRGEKKQEFVSFRKIKEYLQDFDNLEFRKLTANQDIIKKEKDNFANFIDAWKYEGEVLFSDKKEKSIFIFPEGKKEFKSLVDLEKGFLEKVNWFRKKIENKEKISDKEESKFKMAVKDYLDRVLDIFRLVDNFYLKEEQRNKIPVEELDSEFYKFFDEYQEKISDFNPYKYYDEFRNYLTKRNVVADKIRIAFDEGQLLGGWDLNKEKKKLGLIFRKNGNYYLGIINKKKDKNIFDKNKHPEAFVESSKWEKMEYKLLGDLKRQIPRIAFSEKNRDIFGYNSEIQKIKEEYDQLQNSKKENRDNWHKKFNKRKLIKLISYYQKVLEFHPERYKENYKLSWKKPKEYNSLGEFYDDIDKQMYRIKFVNVSDDYLEEKVVKGELYLFQIFNKDFSSYKESNSKENLHTIYFRELFSEENLKNPIFKLSGGAQIFFRDKLEEYQIKTKKDKKGKTVIDRPRYAKDKILFHLPIELNYKAGKANKFNQKINKFLASNPDIKILGIDRGEKHLLYYSLIDTNGKILKSGSLNKIKIGDKEIDFHQKLRERAKEREEARKSWQSITQIKNLKKGYISLVIKKIADLAINENAIIVLEDLNTPFKQKRGGIFEASIYQQFEKALIEKLNFYVDKEKKNHRRAIQLTAPFTTFERIDKQSGIIFYVPANYTSVTCPECGWRQRLYLKYKNINQAVKDFERIKVIYEPTKDRFVFEYGFEVKDNKKKNSFKGIDKIYSDVERLWWNPKYNENGKYGRIEKLGLGEITKELKNVFKEMEIDYHQEGNLSEQLTSKTDKKYSKHWRELYWLFRMIAQIRNLDRENDEENKDFILCPACHFDSRDKNTLIPNGDANGGYNIARKGIILLQRITANPQKPILTISNRDWDEFVRR